MRMCLRVCWLRMCLCGWREIIRPKMSLQSKLLSVFKSSPESLPSAGVYHFVHESGEDKSRIHLRIDSDGSGVMLINANQIYHLNPTAASMSYFHLTNSPVSTSIKALKRAFDVNDSEALSDYQSASQLVDQLINSDACPICDLNLEINSPFSATPSAPYRMDLAITYRCNNNCAHCYNARPRNYPELPTNSWYRILDKLWEIGIPHVVFTGGEPTSRDDLPALIRYAEEKGQITGLNTNGRKISDEPYLKTDLKVRASLRGRLLRGSETLNRGDQYQEGKSSCPDSYRVCFSISEGNKVILNLFQDPYGYPVSYL